MDAAFSAEPPGGGAAPPVADPSDLARHLREIENQPIFGENFGNANWLNLLIALAVIGVGTAAIIYADRRRKERLRLDAEVRAAEARARYEARVAAAAKNPSAPRERDGASASSRAKKTDTGGASDAMAPTAPRAAADASLHDAPVRPLPEATDGTEAGVPTQPVSPTSAPSDDWMDRPFGAPSPRERPATRPTDPSAPLADTTAMPPAPGHPPASNTTPSSFRDTSHWTPVVPSERLDITPTSVLADAAAAAAATFGGTPPGQTRDLPLGARVWIRFPGGRGHWEAAVVRNDERAIAFAYLAEPARQGRLARIGEIVSGHLSGLRPTRLFLSQVTTPSTPPTDATRGWLWLAHVDIVRDDE